MKIGDKVSVLDDAISGKIVGVKGDKITITTDDDFELTFEAHELVVIDKNVMSKDIFNQSMSSILSEKETKKPRRTNRVKPKERNQPPMVVDLHIHQLTNNYKGLSNYEMLNLQMDTAKRQLEFAMSKRIQKIVFIHGVGEGVLKAELEFLFKRYDNLKFYEADYQKYGQGATEVYIFQNLQP